MKIKKDKYLKERGGTFKIIDLKCAKCKSLIFTYQKDGSGWLKRCYLNRIIAPEKYEKLQHNKKIKSVKSLKKLICKCGNIIGYPMKHKDNRLAFRLERSNFLRKNNKRVWE